MPTFLATAVAVALFIAAALVQSSAELTADASQALRLSEFAEDESTFLASTVLQAIAVALLAAPLLYLFRAAQRRNPAVRNALIGILVAGPLFFAAGSIVQTIGYSQVASDFELAKSECSKETGDEQDDCVRDVIRADTMVSTGGGLSLAGSLGLLAGMVYTALQAMRTGLLTRFMGSLGMALGVGVLLLGPLGPPAVILYALTLGLLFIDRWPGGRPPAWDEARAIPWPKPGEAPADGDRDGEGADEEELVEGDAEEIFEPAPAADEGEGSGAPPRKRKRRD